MSILWQGRRVGYLIEKFQKQFLRVVPHVHTSRKIGAQDRGVPPICSALMGGVLNIWGAPGRLGEPSWTARGVPHTDGPSAIENIAGIKMVLPRASGTDRVPRWKQYKFLMCVHVCVFLHGIYNSICAGKN